MMNRSQSRRNTCSSKQVEPNWENKKNYHVIMSTNDSTTVVWHVQTAKHKEFEGGVGGPSPRKENGPTAEEKRRTNIAIHIDKVNSQHKCLSSRTVPAAELATNC